MTGPMMVETGLRMTYSIAIIASLELPRVRHPAAERRLGADDQREPARRSSCSRGASSLPAIAIGAAHGRRQPGHGRVARARSASTAGRPTMAGAPSRARGRRPRPARRAGARRRGHRRRDLASRSGRARCSAWSASRAPARRRSAWRCSGTRAAAAQDRRGTVRIGGRRHRSLASRASAAHAARRAGRLRPAGPGHRLNPALRIGTQLARCSASTVGGRPSAMRDRRGAGGGRRCRRTAAFLRRYPHQLSGGQQQRVAIAMAFACGRR